jgi:hypothetical protein
VSVLGEHDHNPTVRVADDFVPRRVSLTTGDVPAAILRLIAAIEQQDVAFKGLDITIKYPRSPAPPRIHRDTLWGNIAIYEQEV